MAGIRVAGVGTTVSLVTRRLSLRTGSQGHDPLLPEPRSLEGAEPPHSALGRPHETVSLSAQDPRQAGDAMPPSVRRCETPGVNTLLPATDGPE